MPCISIIMKSCFELTAKVAGSSPGTGDPCRRGDDVKYAVIPSPHFGMLWNYDEWNSSSSHIASESNINKKN
ncbi:hypothetical protein TNCV_351121 [Trichonephila clavipes]|nr:hypothetical protein TNCV_351121 [Trichonephila clavipes]